jgi:hypothetical protein
MRSANRLMQLLIRRKHRQFRETLVRVRRRFHCQRCRLPALEACGDNVLGQYLLEQVMHGHFRAPCRLFRGVSAAAMRHCDSNHRL